MPLPPAPEPLVAEFVARHALSAREADIVRAVTTGRSNLEIAEALFISIETVRSHLKHIFTRTDHHSRAELVAAVYRSRTPDDERIEEGAPVRPDAAADPPAAGVAVPERWREETRTAYDADAEAYATKVDGLLEQNPSLRAGLALFADLVREVGGGPVVDVGCGPGYVTRHLQGLGLDAFGVDLSPEMVALARRDHAGIRFDVGDMTDLDLPDRSVAGALAFWSLIHVPDGLVPIALAELRRITRPGGPILIGFHVGDGVRTTTEGYSGRPIKVDSYRRRPARVADWLREAGFRIEAELLLRPDDEVPGAIVIARSPAPNETAGTVRQHGAEAAETSVRPPDRSG